VAGAAIGRGAVDDALVRVRMTICEPHSVLERAPRPAGNRVVQSEGRLLNGDAVVIVPDRTRQTPLRATDQASGNDHGRCRNGSVTHGVPLSGQLTATAATQPP
jgi:hypothetical protein